MSTPDVTSRQAAIERLKLLKEHAQNNLFPPAFFLSTQPKIAFKHGDEEDDSTVMANKQWRDPSWLNAAHYGEDIHPVVPEVHRDERAWHLTEFQDKGTLKREGFRAAASAHEQWWFWLTKAQNHCISMVRSESLATQHVHSEFDSVSAVEAAEEFLARAWSDSPLPRASPVWAKNMAVSDQFRGPKLAPRNFQARSEAGAVRRIKKRADKSGVNRGGVKWGKLLVWLPGGIRVSMELYGDESMLDVGHSKPSTDALMKLNPIAKHKSLHQLGEIMPKKLNNAAILLPSKRRSIVHNPSPEKHKEIDENLATGLMHSAPHQVCNTIVVPEKHCLLFLSFFFFSNFSFQTIFVHNLTCSLSLFCTVIIQIQFFDGKKSHKFRNPP
jgi:hypothetical protein